MAKKLLYGEMTWPEIRESAKEGRAVVVPIGQDLQFKPGPRGRRR